MISGFTQPAAAAIRQELAFAAEQWLWTWLLRTRIRAATAPVRRFGRWIWAARWRRILIRAVTAYHLVGILLLLFAVPARADDGSTNAGVPDNQVFSWMTVKDSHGISVWRYFMSLDHGNIHSPEKAAYSYTIEVEYEIYRAIAASTIWLLRYVLQFDWLTELTSPARNIGAALTSITGQLHLTGTLLTAAALTAGIWMLRGKWSTGIYELLISCLIAVVAVGVLANPVERVAGPDGLIIHARDAGLELADGITHRGNTASDPNEMLDQLSQSLADSLIRRPTQALNFGTVIDDMPGANGQKCISAWDHGFDAVKGNTVDTLKDNIRGCEGGGDGLLDSNGGPMKAYADNPGPGQVAAAAALIIGGIVLMLFGWCLAFAVFASTVAAIYQALKAIPGLLFGIAPGVSRGSLWKTAAHLAMALTTIVFAIVFVAGYMLVIQSFFSASTGGSLFKRIFTLDIVLVAGVVVFRRGVKSVRGFADALAGKLAQRPGAAPTQIQRSTPHAGMLQSAYYTAQMGGQAVRIGNRAAHAVGSFAAKQHASAIGGVHAAAATASTAASAGTAAAAWAAWHVVKKAAGGAHVLAAAGGKGPGSGGGASSSPRGKSSRPRRTAGSSRSAARTPYEEAIAQAASRRARRPKPDEVWKPGVKRRVGSAPPSPRRPNPAVPPRPAQVPGARLSGEQQRASGLWIPSAARPTTTPPGPAPRRPRPPRPAPSALGKSSAPPRP